MGVTMTQKHETRILFVEDTPADVELAQREIQKSGMNVSLVRVETKEEFLEALRGFQPGI